MIKIILAFLFVFTLVYVSIELVRSLSKAQKWQLTKTVIYATVIAAVSTVLLTTIVFLF